MKEICPLEPSLLCQSAHVAPEKPVSLCSRRRCRWKAVETSPWKPHLWAGFASEGSLAVGRLDSAWISSSSCESNVELMCSVMRNFLHLQQISNATSHHAPHPDALRAAPRMGRTFHAAMWRLNGTKDKVHPTLTSICEIWNTHSSDINTFTFRCFWSLKVQTELFPFDTLQPSRRDSSSFKNSSDIFL